MNPGAVSTPAPGLPPAAQKPLLVLLALVVGAPLLSTTLTTGQPEFALGLFLFGSCALLSNGAAYSTTAGAARQRIGFALVGLIALPLLLVSVYPTSVMPIEVYGEGDAGLTIALTWLVLLSAYFAGTPDLGLPSALPMVPALSVFGLNASKNSGPEILLAFALFVVASFCVLILDSFRQQARRLSIPTAAYPAMIRRQLLLGGAWGGGVVALGLLFWPLFSRTPELMLLSLTPGLESVVPQAPLPSYGNFMGALELSGGSYEFNDTVWMRVRTPLTYTRWRGRVLTEYDGRTWRTGAGFAEVPAEQQNGWWQVQPAPPRHRLVREEFLPQVHMPAVVYASGEPVRVRCEQRVFLSEAEGTPRLRRLMRRGARYAVESAVPVTSAPTLRTANTPPPPELAEAYLQLPPNLATIQRLAREIAGGPLTPLARAESLKQYLTANCLYSLRSPSIPREEDAVTYFVTVSREGACDLFASALVVMCRAVGVPARLVTGFRDSGERDRGWAVVRERDAHAWAEVYVAPHGWVAIDPTEASLVDPSTLQLLAQTLTRRTRLPAMLFPYMVGAALTVLLLYLLRGAVRAARAARTPAGAARSISHAYLSACRALARRGLVRSEEVTPWEFERAVASQSELAAVHESWKALTRLVVLATFTPEVPTETEAARARALAGIVRRARR